MDEEGGFRFNFSQSDGEESEKTSPCGSPKTSTEIIPERPAAVLTITAKELEKVARQTEGEVTSAQFCSDGISIRHVLSTSVQANIQVQQAQRGSDDESESDCARAISQNSDLIPGVYEGGLKVWECANDLVEYLHSEKFHFDGKLVLEIGCGAALPGLYAVLLGAKSVDFQDYNEEVLRHVTVPNVAANMVAALRAKQEKHPRPLRKSARNKANGKQDTSIRLADAAKAVSVGFLAGDWGMLEEMFSKESPSRRSYQYDVILTSETIYRQSAHGKLLKLIKCCLAPSGVVLLAAKSHYFGVGGSVHTFEQSVREDGDLTWKMVFKSTGQGVMREIVELRWASADGT